jgi:uncharacterized cupin superfamily protein
VSSERNAESLLAGFRFAPANFVDDDMPEADLLEGNPKLESAEFWRNEDGSIVFGASRISSPCRLAGAIPELEYLYVVRGSMTVELKAGGTFHASEGDTLTIPAMTPYECIVHEPFEDVYVLLTPKDQ